MVTKNIDIIDKLTVNLFSNQWFVFSENQLLSYRGEHIFVETGHEAFVNLGEQTFYSLDKEGENCRQFNEGEISYSEVSTIFTESKKKKTLYSSSWIIFIVIG